MAKSKHDKIAENLAKRFGSEYKKHKGIDIVTRDRVIEVETTRNGIYQGINQVKRSSKARYIAVNDRNIENALNATKRTGIGVMNEKGKIIKKASRKR
ncbi:MAG TPA: hypothetical protein EYP21_09820 [Syntrophaceae bacterium]|nr:hypothetical protein [Syntrophaceae bacterium]